jgi:RHS repeat-associated protein
MKFEDPRKSRRQTVPQDKAERNKVSRSIIARQLFVALWLAGLLLSEVHAPAQVLSSNLDNSIGVTNGAPSDPSGPPAPVPSPPMVLTNPAPSEVPQFPSFSAQPSTKAITQTRVFEEPLVPTGREPTQNENAALAHTLLAFANRTNSDDFSALTQYLQDSPDTPWSASVRFSLGLECYNTGYYSKAIGFWEDAWSELEEQSGGTALADRTIGELAKMYARIGNAAALEDIFEEIGPGPVSGPATELIAGARQALWLMRNRPEIAYRCGPLALKSICGLLKPQVDVNEIVLDSASTAGKGFSLSQLVGLAQQLQINFQAAKRLPGAPLIVPCVVHWKVGHYAAVLQQQGDRYFIADPTFGISRWVSQRALDAETSGYFLIPPGPLPNNWQAVDDSAAQTVWGRGVTGSSDPNDTAPYDLMADPNCDSRGMATFNAHLMLVSLHIEDTPISFAPPRGPPIRFTATYNQREANQPANFSYSNFGQKWTFNWLSYLTDNGTNTAGDVQYYVGGGGTETFTYQTNGSYTINWRNQASLVRLSSTNYMMVFADGSTNYFSQPDGSVGNTRRVFLTRVIDRTGYTNALNYDSSLRLVSVTDPQAGVTNLTFFYNADPIATDPQVIQKVTDRYGRSATFGYGNTGGQLQSIVDVLGLTSQVFYASSTFIEALQTPYGTSTFEFGDAGAIRWLEMTDAEGGTSRVEFNQQLSTGVPDSDPGTLVPWAAGGFYLRNYILYGRNTFYWDKKALREAPGDYSKARLYHWLHNADLASAVGTLESYKEPLENRVWFNYPGQSSASSATIYGSLNLPTVIGRVMEDGTPQYYQTYRNALGKITASVDPVWRSNSFVYAANLMDLLEVRGANNELIASYTYNAQHLPVTSKDAAGQTTKVSYNAYGQVIGITNALNQVTSLTYDSGGRLITIVGPTNTATTTFGYDSFDRVNSVTDSDGYSVMTVYDSFDRPLTNTYPNGTTETLTYVNLDPQTYKDRSGKLTQYGYDRLRHLTQITEATNWVTHVGWCDCGGLSSVTDPLGRITTWLHDLQGRVTAKQYPNGSSVHYGYEAATSRVRTFTNERGQTRTNYYYQDGSLNGVVYSNPTITPTVVFYYDPNYFRLTGIVDGSGSNHFNYYPITSTPALGAGRLKSIQASTTFDTLTYTYDALGRELTDVLTNTLFSPAVNVRSNAFSYDVLGRITSDAANWLGVFNFTYAGASARLASIIYPVSQTTSFGYYDVQTDLRLKTMTNAYAGTVLSSFDYGYNREGRMTNQVGRISQPPNAGRITTSQFGYDAVGQLATASSNSSPSYFQYSYDLAGNRVTEQNDTSSWRAWYNPLNQIEGKDRGLSLTNRVCEWDEENRLVAVTDGSLRAEMLYDGFGRLAFLAEKTNGVLFMRHWFVSSGGKLAEELYVDSGTNAHFYWYYDYGFRYYDYAANAYITRDVRGSVHELDFESGLIFAQYDYDPYGRQLALGSYFLAAPSFGFAGLYGIPGHKLNLATHRAYDPDLGRWLSRDPIGEAAGMNLYKYSGNDPINFVDPSGLCAQRGFVGGAGQEFDPNSGQIKDRGGNAVSDQLNPLNPLNFEGEGSPWGFSVEGAAAERATPSTTAMVSYSGPSASGWPGNRGFLTGPYETELRRGTLVDRFGSRNGTFVSPQGTPFPMRGLPAHYETQMPLEAYEVVSPLKVKTGLTAPAFGQPGYGLQHELPFSVQELIDLGVLKPK